MAKIFLGSNETFPVGANGRADIYGVSGGNEVVVATAGSVINVDQNVERIELSGASTSYKFAVSGNVVNVLSGTTVVATIGTGNVQQTIAFADGSAVLALTALNAATLGGQAIPTTAATVSNISLNTTDKSASAVAVAGSTSANVTLTTGFDKLTATTAGTTFTAPIIDNANTLQSGDTLVGKGADTLVATIGNAQKFAISANTTGVTSVQIQAQTNSLDATNNNTSQTNQVQIDAQNLNGVFRFESNNSRSDLLIEDVRLPSSKTFDASTFAADRQEVILNADRTVNTAATNGVGITNYAATSSIPLTSDVTLAYVSSDPGHVDYGVYFDQNSLRAGITTSTSQLTIQLIDIKGAQASTPNPLLANTYNGLKIFVDNQQYTIPLTAADGVSAITTTYSAIVDKINAFVTANTTLAGKLTATIGSNFTKLDSDTGTPVTIGQDIVLTTKNAVFSGGAARWTTVGDQPATSNLYATVTAPNTSSTTPLVTTNVVLDDVGRGATGGNFVAGSLATGDTSNSLGIDRFNVHVDRTSRLEAINSTNNALKEVYIDSANNSTNATGIHNGDLFVTGQVFDGANPSLNQGINAPGYAGDGVQVALPGIVTANGGSQFNQYGFNDVRVIDASALKGAITFNAVITPASIDKYLNLVDQAPATASADNTNFIYTGSAQNDNITVALDPQAVATSKTSILSGREDLTLSVDGGAGNDTINVGIYTAKDGNGNYLAAGNTQAWYANQKLNANITVNGGDGNDTITTPGAGDKNINGGAGSDTIYTDNTGRQVVTNTSAVTLKGPLATTTWVENAASLALVGGLNPADNINNIQSDTNGSYNIVGSKMVVKFDGYSSVAVPISFSSTTFKTTDLLINQAIKLAINSDSVLSKLLIAQDGPANTLVVTSKIDGQHVASDLSFSVQGPSTFDIANAGSALINIYNAQHGIAANTALPAGVTLATITAEQVANITSANLGLWSPELANDGTSNIIGAKSVTTSDNKINAGGSIVNGLTGVDVVVLGTTNDGATTLGSSNETVSVSPSFGKLVIANFDTAGVGADKIDFSGFFGEGTSYNATASATAYNVIYGTPAAATDGFLHVYINGTTVSSVSAPAAGAAAGTSVAPVTQGDLSIIGLTGSASLITGLTSIFGVA